MTQNNEAEDSGNEPEVEIEQPDTPDVEIEVDTPEEPPKQAERVDFTPEQQKRFNDVFKQAKMSDARNKMLTDMLTEQQRQLDEMKSRFNQTDAAEAENILISRIQEARENGDTAAEFKLIGELTDFKADAKVRAAIPKPQPVDLGIPAEDVNYIKETVFEQDANGQYVRPWLHQGNHRYNDMLKHATLISAAVQEEFGQLDTAEVMARLDTVMSKKTTQQPRNNSRAPDPMGGNLTPRNPRGTLKLSSAEAEIARKLGVDPKVYAQSRDSLRKQ